MERILGVRVDNLRQKELLEKVSGFLADGKFHQIATVGPEFVLKAQKNKEFRNILNNCDLNVADGFGLKCAFWRFGEHLKTRFTGIDLMMEILKIAENRGLGVFLACNKYGLSSWEETRDAMLKLYPNLKIDGIDIDFSCHSELVEESRRISINTFNTGSFANTQDGKNNPRIVFANFGAPYQEIFLNSLKNDIMGIAMGVGGGFDFLTRKIRRAPVFLRKLGLEWLWRLFQQPKRWKRIWNAAVIFPIRVIFS